MSTKAAAARKKAVPASPPAASTQPLHWVRSQSFLLGALLLIATLAVYFPVTHHPFLNFDDYVYVVNNTHLASGLDLETVAWSFSTFYQANWHPLTWLSHALDVQVFQLQPGGHHAVNMLFQAANVLLLFWVLRRATGYVGRSAVVAGLFALHPVNVESVAWVSERKNLLSMFFFLLGMAAYHWYLSAPADAAQQGQKRRTATTTADDGAPNRGRYAVMAVCFVLGLMAKPQIITFPFILLLWDYWPLRRMAIGKADAASGMASETLLPVRSFWWLVKEKIPLFAICAIDAVLTVAAQKSGGAVATLRNYPLSVRVTNAIVAYVRYIGKAVWPTRLAVLYPHPWHPLPMWQVLPSLLALTAITILVLNARRRRYLLVGWLWFLGAMVPMIGIVHVGNQAMADRYAYLPYIGLFIMACWGVADLAARRRVPVAVLWVVSVVVLAALAVVTQRQLSYWDDNIVLWNHTLAVTDDNYIAHDNLAQLLMDQGQTDEGMQQYRTALSIYEADPNSNLAIAVYDHQHGDLQGALARYRQMTSETPDGPGRAELFSNTGLVYLDLRDNADAEKNFQRAVAIDPQNVRGWLGLGVVADREGDMPAAIANYKHANSVKPLKVTWLLLAKVLQQTGDTAGAQAARERAKLLSRDEKTTETYSGGILQQ